MVVLEEGRLGSQEGGLLPTTSGGLHPPAPRCSGDRESQAWNVPGKWETGRGKWGSLTREEDPRSQIAQPLTWYDYPGGLGVFPGVSGGFRGFPGV